MGLTTLLTEKMELTTLLTKKMELTNITDYGESLKEQICATGHHF